MEIIKAEIMAGASSAWEAAIAGGDITEAKRISSEARWLRGFSVAAQHYITTGEKYVAPPSASERLLNAIFGTKE